MACAVQRICRAAFGRESPAMSVSQMNDSMPVALRMAMASRRISALPSRGSSGASASANHPIARPCRSGRSWLPSSESRSIVRC